MELRCPVVLNEKLQVLETHQGVLYLPDSQIDIQPVIGLLNEAYMTLLGLEYPEHFIAYWLRQSG